jgi:23S rRNA pseudouridine1911/1915/1917 synthase
MMKIPHKKTEVETEIGAQPLLPEKRTGAGEKRVDYSANASHALTVPADCGGLRLDQALARLWPKHSRNRLQNWIREGRVSVGGRIVSEQKHKLWGGELLEVVEAPDENLLSSSPEAIALNIVHEDETLMVVAKTLEAQTDLVRQLQARTVKRYYQALVRGVLESGGTVDEPIGRHPTQRTKMAIVRTGKPARTHYRVVERFIDCTLVECALETGRTHQIRVHMTALGHPLVGDQVYGGGASRVPIGPEFPRQALHARRLGLIHPATGKPMLWKSNMPDDMAELIETARMLAFEARALAEEESEDWDDDFDDGPEIIYAYGDNTEDDDDLE